MSYDKKQIGHILGIGSPLLMLDLVTELVPGVRGEGTREFTSSDWFFKYHLKEEPLVPGVLLVEGSLQLFALTLYNVEDHIGHYSFVQKCSSVFHKKVSPGMSVIYIAEVLRKRRGIFEGSSKCFSSDGLVCESTFSFVSPHLLPRVQAK